MSLLSLKDIELYKQLSKRTSNNAKIYAGILLPLASDADNLLQYIKKEFPQYPDHGLQHSFRILQYVSRILNVATCKKMSDTELFCFIMAALFHDTGMALFNHDKSEDIRDNHHEFSGVVLEKYIDEKLGIIESKDRLKPVISFICRAHGMTRETLYKDTLFSMEDTIDFDTVRYSLLSILLRIGDLMDLEQSRTNEFSMSIFSDIYSTTALNHNLRHKHVKIYNYTDTRINITVTVDNYMQKEIWEEWLRYLTEEIVYANTKLRNYSVFFPEATTNIEHGVDFTKTSSQQQIRIADSELVVVRSFLIGSGIESYFNNLDIQMINFPWDTSLLDACQEGSIDFCVFNKLSTESYMRETPNLNFEILGSVGHSMGGRNFSAVVHSDNPLLGKTLSEIKKEFHGYTIYIGLRNDRFRNLMYIFDVNEQYFTDNNVKIINIPDVSTSVLLNDPTAIVFGGQNLRLEALSMPNFCELIPFSNLPASKQSMLRANSENVFIINNDSKIRLNITLDFMSTLLQNFNQNVYNRDKLNRLVSHLANTCSFTSNSYEDRCRFVRHILYESYRFGNPVVN